MTGQAQTTATDRPAAQDSEQTGVTAQRRPANSLTDVRPVTAGCVALLTMLRARVVKGTIDWRGQVHN
jgi:hypothetical protein